MGMKIGNEIYQQRLLVSKALDLIVESAANDETQDAVLDAIHYLEKKIRELEDEVYDLQMMMGNEGY